MLWEFKQIKNLGIPLFFLWSILSLPYKIRGLVLKILGKSSKRYGFSYHEYLWNVTRTFHLPEPIPFKIEECLFQNPDLHEPEVSRFLSKTHGDLFVDVGANLGRYTIMLSSNYKKIIAIEPEPSNMKHLKRNLLQAGIDNVDLLQIAISDREGHARLYLARHSGGHTIKKGYYNKYIKVKSSTLDNVLKHESKVDLVKVDVEGAEWNVLKGAEKSMHKIRSWMIELHDLNRKIELERIFKSKGYKIKWLDRNHIYCWR